MKNNDILKENELLSTYALVDEVIEKGFLHHIDKYTVIPADDKSVEIKTQLSNIRLFQLLKIVYDKEEDILDKLTTVYNTVHTMSGDIVMIIDSNSEEVELFIGVKNDNSSTINKISKGFESSFNGNFPGCRSEKLLDISVTKATSITLLNKIFDDKAQKAVTVANGIPNLKDDNKENFTQGLEKFIEAMSGKEYTALLIADSINNSDISQRKSAFESIYSSLAPFGSQEISFGSNESNTITEGISKSFTSTVNKSLTHTNSHTNGTNESTSHTLGANVSGMVGAGIGFAVGGPVGAVAGGMIGGMMGINYSQTRQSGSNESDTTGDSVTSGKSESDMDGTNSSDSNTQGTSETYQINYENKTVKNLLEKIDTQIKRIDESEDYGMYDFAAYFISNDYDTSQVAASTYRAITRGKNSSAEKSGIVSWNIDMSNSNIIPYLKQLKHPKIELENTQIIVTPTTLISSKELSLAISLPRKSVKGVPVTKSVEFGRDIHFLEDNLGKKNIQLGYLYHLGKEESKSNVTLDVNSLSMHTLITGSTGAGKSNTIYTILNELSNKGKKFLVIEPAKGEYKNIFGGRKDVNVFGSNPKHTDILKINPFAFPDEIHVLEHIDRLIEIFNACWPMYAAMPAVLKDATLKSYIACGWDVDNSICIGEIKYPTFNILLSMLEEVIETSHYSDEMKSNYKGALLTRIKSLTNGLLGQMLNQSEGIEEEILFDSNVIVDISRIGSMETKSLLMGMLVLKLIEYRYAKKDGTNSELQHVTVLEEAHNILKRTSTEQSAESSNAQGKAVEMLSNAIAEMRTYGEGFIIADQSPNMLDMSAIRNTGTKIIMRLPEFTDRNDIGKSAALNDNQIDEIPKLSTGVAVVYQNNWLEAVLCKVDEFRNVKPFKYDNKLIERAEYRKKNLGKILQILLMTRVDNISKKEIDVIDYDILVMWVSEQSFDVSVKNKLNFAIEQCKSTSSLDLQRQDKFEELSKLVFTLLDGKKILSLVKSAQDLSDYDNKLSETIRQYVETQKNIMLEVAIKQMLLSHEGKETSDFKELYFSWVEMKRTVLGDMV